MNEFNKIAIENSANVVDLRGLRCPLPALHIRKWLMNNITINDITILLTDPSALQDIPLAVQDLNWISQGMEEMEATAIKAWRLRLAMPEGSRQPPR